MLTTCLAALGAGHDALFRPDDEGSRLQDVQHQARHSASTVAPATLAPRKHFVMLRGRVTEDNVAPPACQRAGATAAFVAERPDAQATAARAERDGDSNHRRNAGQDAPATYFLFLALPSVTTFDDLIGAHFLPFC